MRDAPLDHLVRAYFGHHKCATTWTQHILLKSINELGLRYHLTRGYKEDVSILKKQVVRKGTEFFLFQEANAQIPEAFDHLKGFHVVRDPRDICVSAYYSHLYSHPVGQWKKLKQHRYNLQNSSKEEGLLAEMDFLEGIFYNMLIWPYHNENILEVRMETLTEQPVRSFLNIFEFLGLLDETKKTDKISFKLRAILNRAFRRLFGVRYRLSVQNMPANRLKKIVQKNSFNTMAGGRKKGEESKKSHYRKGIPGDWKKHFNSKHKNYFKKKYGKLLVKLGYEENNNW